MSYRTIVVHLDSGPRCAVRVALAVRLAASQGAHLIGLAPTGLADVVVSMGTAAPDILELIHLSASVLRERAEAAAVAFERQAKSAALTSYECRVVQGKPIDAITSHGRCSDLVVVGQGERPANAEDQAADLPQQTLLHTGCPVLAVPASGNFDSVGRHVVVAWKDTREAARSLRDALPLLQAADRVDVLEIVAAASEEAARRVALLDVLAWLGRHGVDAGMRVETSALEAGEALLARAGALSADLIVMGAYGHSRLREWILGGATRHLLAHMTVPVVMSH